MKSKLEELWLSIFREIVDRCFNDVPTMISSGAGAEICNIKPDGDPTIGAELHAEDIALSVLSRENIPVKIYSEERGYLLDSFGAEYLVLFDPIDATYLAERNLSGSCVAISVLTVDTLEPFAAMVGDYYNRSIYWATRDGAFRNGERIRPSNISTLDKAYVSTCYGKTSRLELMLEGKGVVKPVYWLNTTGGILSMVWVGSGQVDAYFDLMLGYKPFDFLAGAYIASMAGAIVTDEFGRDLVFSSDMNRRYKFIIAANKGLHSEILRVYNKAK